MINLIIEIRINALFFVIYIYLLNNHKVVSVYPSWDTGEVGDAGIT